MLQRDGGELRGLGEAGLVENGFAVQNNREVLALHRNFKGVPFADGFIGIFARRDRRANFGVGVIITIAVDFAGADPPVPDIDLVLAGAANIDPGIGDGHFG